MVDDGDGRGLFELSEPRTEPVGEYRSRVGDRAHDEVLDDVLGRRWVPERDAVERIELSAQRVAELRGSQRSPDGFEGLRERWQARADAELARDKEYGRRVLAGWSGWSGDRQVDRLTAHAREQLARAVREDSDPADELERADAVRRWQVDDEVALADADGVLDGWQW